MSSREKILVPQEEIARQKAYIKDIKESILGTEKKYVIKTYGCQMNENDSEKLSGFLEEMGYSETVSENYADLIIYNTCCVRENAELKVYGHLGALKKLKTKKPGMVIAVCGCMMQQTEVVEHIKKKYRHVDLIFGTHNLYKFPELLHNHIISGRYTEEIIESDGFIAEGLPIERKAGVKAWVTVMYGCNNFCSYCIVPYVRGRERSRTIENIAAEVEGLVNAGYKEVTLLGQNVNSYGKDLDGTPTFAQLLRHINEIEGLERIRFMTSHPKDISDDLIHSIAELDKVCEHLHLPVQSGSSRILKEMNRKYTKEHFIDVADKVKKYVPGISLTTDIIVGFPGETEEDFLETLDVLEKVRFDFAFTFLYSKRTGTPASRSLAQVEEHIKKERFDRLVNLQNNISKEINDKLKGSTVEVLVEGASRDREDILTGRTRTNKIVNFKGTKEMVGKIASVRVDRVQTWSLEGSVLNIK